MIQVDSSFICPAVKEANAEPSVKFFPVKRSPLRLRLAVTSHCNIQAVWEDSYEGGPLFLRINEWKSHCFGFLLLAIPCWMLYRQLRGESGILRLASTDWDCVCVITEDDEVALGWLASPISCCFQCLNACSNFFQRNMYYIPPIMLKGKQIILLCTILNFISESPNGSPWVCQTFSNRLPQILRTWGLIHWEPLTSLLL